MWNSREEVAGVFRFARGMSTREAEAAVGAWSKARGFRLHDWQILQTVIPASAEAGFDAALAELVQKMGCDGTVLERFGRKALVMRCNPCAACSVEDCLHHRTPKLVVRALTPEDGGPRKPVW